MEGEGRWVEEIGILSTTGRLRKKRRGEEKLVWKTRVLISLGGGPVARKRGGKEKAEAAQKCDM